MDIFSACQKINDNIVNGEHVDARNNLIQLLAFHEEKKIEYTPLVNHLIRQTGLYPYIKTENALWQDRFIYEAFKVDIGGKEATLHREQSHLLSQLLEGNDIAVSAPTSFGKSFVIDAFIALKQPKNVVIIVPTIALMDETRRRLYKKFSDTYRIITTSDVELTERNIFVFPQERAISYLNKIASIDLLIIDEFYKASEKFDKERSPSLLKAIIKFGEKSKQKYFLAPNIKSIKDNVFTKGMKFIELLNFNTVYLEKHERFKEIFTNEAKNEVLLEILLKQKSKSLIYAGTHTGVDKIANLIVARTEVIGNPLLNNFGDWLEKNYDANWNLVALARRGTGIHTGKLHRSIGQIQIKLFEEKKGFKNIISTSSIIEGVNTSAENVIVWSNKIGTSNLNDFTYKNIIGRGGRMFKHFIGRIFLLEPPPKEELTQLEIPFPDKILGDIDEEKYKVSLTKEQIGKIIDFKRDMRELLGKEPFDQLLKNNTFQLNDSELIKKIAREMHENPAEWNGIGYLNSDDVDSWDRLLYKLINLQPGRWDARYGQVVAFIKILSKNWKLGIPELLKELEEYEIDIGLFFKLERVVAYRFSALLSDVNELQKVMLDKGIDVAPFISKLSHAFLPTVVYQLEEYGLPRMISKKLHQEKLINFLNPNLTLHEAVKLLKGIGKEKAINSKCMDSFDKYILEYFYDGITLDKKELLLN